MVSASESGADSKFSQSHVVAFSMIDDLLVVLDSVLVFLTVHNTFVVDRCWEKHEMFLVLDVLPVFRH